MSKKELFVVALTRPSLSAAQKLADGLGAKLCAPRKFAGEGGFDEPVATLIEGLWPRAGGLFLFMATGIAVRSIAGLVADKRTDPAVVVFDQQGRFAIPLLSGHLGRANEYALEAARILGATPVITTATDCLGLPAVEVWARDKGYAIEDFSGVVKVNSALVNCEPLGIYVDPSLPSWADASDLAEFARVTDDLDAAMAFEGVKIALSHRILPAGFDLTLRPKVLALGAGARKDADPARVTGELPAALEERGFSPLSVAVVASAEAKANEQALVQLAQKLCAPFVTFSSQELEEVDVPNPSKRVMRELGTKSVAEAGALLASGGQTLVMEKIGREIWTASLALMARRLPQSSQIAEEP